MEDDRQTEGDSLGWGLGGVGDAQAPGVGLSQQRVLGEERTGVAVWTTAEQQQVEEGQLDRIAGGKDGDEQLLVLVGHLLRIVEVLLVNGVDLGLAQLLARNLVQQLLLEQLVVAVLVIEGHAALVGEEYLPLGEVDLVAGAAIAFGQEGLCESLG